MKIPKYTGSQINELAKKAVVEADVKLIDKKLREMFPQHSDESMDDYENRLKTERFWLGNSEYGKKYDELKDL